MATEVIIPPQGRFVIKAHIEQSKGDSGNVIPVRFVSVVALDDDGNRVDFSMSHDSSSRLVSALITESNSYIEPVLHALIHEAKRKNSVEGCRETAMVITKLEEALMWQVKRMASHFGGHVKAYGDPVLCHDITDRDVAIG
jgi:hypothetical protein